MKVLVTGSEGSLMQEVIPLLMQKGHTVIGIDNFARYGEIERERAYKFIRGDLTDPEFVDKVVRDVDAVMQAAALIYGVGGFNKYPADILSKDINLHQNIMHAMLRNGIKKMVYISSSMVYERCVKQPSAEADVDESLIPSTDYGLSKLVGERITRAFHRQYDIGYTIWRPFNIITPHEVGESDLGSSHVFADYIKNIVKEQRSEIPIIGDGEQIRCFTWIGDVARGIADFSFDERAANETFNLGNPEPITMKALAAIIYDGAKAKNLIGGNGNGLSFKTEKSFPDDVRIRIPDVSKAREILGWEPTLKVSESVERCLDLMK
ncbi:MAG: NAD(P)-dependent oxidoreductase [Acidobacteria bacterium]|nr:NAD(P)-dependent oxidoreductase [Acidobacteriota bacterium]